MCVWVSECVCVDSERERVCVSERMCVCVCVCVIERERRLSERHSQDVGWKNEEVQSGPLRAGHLSSHKWPGE